MAEKVPENNEDMSEECSASSDIGSHDCDPCSDDGKQLAAAGFCVDCDDYLCTECYRAHKRARPSRNHVVKAVTNPPTTKSGTGTEKCSEHLNEPMKWYCKSHDQVFCDLCKLIDHRQCEGLSTLSDISKDVLSSEQLKQIEDRLKQLQGNFNENKTTVTTNSSMVEKYYGNLIESITRHISKMRDKDRDMMKGLHLTCDMAESKITSLMDELNSLKENGDTEHVFLAMKKAKSQLALLDDRLASVQRDNKIQEYHYVPEITSPDDNLSGILGRIMLVPSKLEDISVKTPSDTSTCWITGMDRLSDNSLVLADMNNRKIKLVDMTSKTVTSEIKLDISPWDLTRIDDKRIAVTTYDNKKILIVSVSDTLTVHKTIDKSEFDYCQGIVCSDDALIVSYNNPDTIQILDLEGGVKQTIESTDKDGTVRFGDIEYIAHSPDTNTLYLSDCTNNKVLSMTLDGKILSSFTHEHLIGTKGITVGRDGRIFVCSFNSHKINEISPDLSKGKITFDEKDSISRPYSIMYNDKEHKLYVGSDNMDTIKVFLI